MLNILLYISYTHIPYKFYLLVDSGNLSYLGSRGIFFIVYGTTSLIGVPILNNYFPLASLLVLGGIVLIKLMKIVLILFAILTIISCVSENIEAITSCWLLTINDN